MGGDVRPRSDASASRDDLRVGPVTVLGGPAKGHYPEGDSLVAQGRREAVRASPDRRSDPGLRVPLSKR